MSRCSATRVDGQPCSAYAMKTGPYCFTHDPDRDGDRSEARRAGGHARTAAVMPATPPPVELRSATDVGALIGDTINMMLRGELDSRTANAVGYLAGVWLKAWQAGELAERLARIEAAVRPGHVVGLQVRELSDMSAAPGESDSW